jgi:hypothetical protein
MSEFPWKLLKTFIWPKYCEEGPPKYIDAAFFNKDLIDDYGKFKEPAKSVVELIVLGYRPVTSLSILAALIENQNRPMYGAQLGATLERQFQLPKGWFTKTRYYDGRIGKLLKILTRLNILEEIRVKDWRTNKEYIGYCIAKDIYPLIKDKLLAFSNGQGLSILASPIPRKTLEGKTTMTKHCPHCNNITTSTTAKYCEVCGTLLKAECPNCKKEINLEYSFCIYCGKPLT